MVGSAVIETLASVQERPRGSRVWRAARVRRRRGGGPISSGLNRQFEADAAGDGAPRKSAHGALYGARWAAGDRGGSCPAWGRDGGLLRYPLTFPVWSAEGRGGTLAAMHPTGVASAAWVFASAPSKAPFYLAGGLLAGWAVLLSATGLTHPDFPGTPARARVVMLTSALLVVATVTAAVLTAGQEQQGEAARGAGRPAGAAATSSALRLTADPTGRLAYDKKQATVMAGKLTIDFVNRSALPHNVTIAKGAKVVAHTQTISAATSSTAATLPPGEYVFYCSVDAHRQGGMQGTLTAK
jgi:plastocyanin